MVEICQPPPLKFLEGVQNKPNAVPEIIQKLCLNRDIGDKKIEPEKVRLPPLPTGVLFRIMQTLQNVS